MLGLRRLRRQRVGVQLERLVLGLRRLRTDTGSGVQRGDERAQKGVRLRLSERRPVVLLKAGIDRVQDLLEGSRGLHSKLVPGCLSSQRTTHHG